MADELTITRPDDWHLHVRDGAALATVVPASARQFGRAIIMPNLKPPVTTTQAALAYRDRIVAAVPPDASFEPLMTLYLTDTLGADEIRRAREAGIAAVKLYPAGATTNSDAGVTALDKTYAALEAMQKLGMPLLVHGEVTDPAVDLFDRERVFLETQLIQVSRVGHQAHVHLPLLAVEDQEADVGDVAGRADLGRCGVDGLSGGEFRGAAVGDPDAGLVVAPRLAEQARRVAG